MTMIETEPAVSAAEFVDRQTAARRLGLSTRQLDRLVEAGRLTRYRRPVGRLKVAYKISDLDALLHPEPTENTDE